MSVARIDWYWLSVFVDGEALNTVEVNIPPADGELQFRRAGASTVGFEVLAESKSLSRTLSAIVHSQQRDL